MGVQQGRDHLIEARSHRRSIITRGIISARGRTNETVTNSRGLKVSSKLIDVKLPPRSSGLSFVDGRFNLGGREGPGHQPMPRRTTRITYDVNCRWPVYCSKLRRGFANRGNRNLKIYKALLKS